MKWQDIVLLLGVSLTGQSVWGHCEYPFSQATRPDQTEEIDTVEIIRESLDLAQRGSNSKHDHHLYQNLLQLEYSSKSKTLRSNQWKKLRGLRGSRDLNEAGIASLMLLEHKEFTPYTFEALISWVEKLNDHKDHNLSQIFLINSKTRITRALLTGSIPEAHQKDAATLWLKNMTTGTDQPTVSHAFQSHLVMLAASGIKVPKWLQKLSVLGKKKKKRIKGPTLLRISSTLPEHDQLLLESWFKGSKGMKKIIKSQRPRVKKYKKSAKTLISKSLEQIEGYVGYKFIKKGDGKIIIYWSRSQQSVKWRKLYSKLGSHKVEHKIIPASLSHIISQDQTNIQNYVDRYQVLLKPIF